LGTKRVLLVPVQGIAMRNVIGRKETLLISLSNTKKGVSKAANSIAIVFSSINTISWLTEPTGEMYIASLEKCIWL